MFSLLFKGTNFYILFVKIKTHISSFRRNCLSVKFRILWRKRKLPGEISWRNAGEKCDIKAKSINFMMKHKISWRNAGEIPLGFLQEILQLIMEKNEKCFFLSLQAL